MNIGYHTRKYGNDSVKLSGGSFGGSLDMETVNRLVDANFTVTVRSSGTPVFVDRNGREVRLYVSVDVCKTRSGERAIQAWREESRRQAERDRQRREQEEGEVERLMADLTHEEIVRRLGGEGGGTT